MYKLEEFTSISSTNKTDPPQYYWNVAKNGIKPHNPTSTLTQPGADPGFQLRGGEGGAHLKKLRRAEGGAKNFGVFRVKNHDFTPKKSDFFQMQREARKFLGYFVWKITILRQKIIFFPILRGARAGCAPLNPPLHMLWTKAEEVKN